MSEADDKYCGAKLTSGKGTCRHMKGWGTDHLGFGQCKKHGGSTTNGNKAAIREQVASFATEADIDPLDVLLRTIRLSWGAIQWTTQALGQTEYQLAEAVRAGNLDRTITLERRFLLLQQMHGEWIDRAAKHAKLALDAGIDERRVQVEENVIDMLAKVIQAFVLDPDLGLSSEQRAIAPQLVRHHLMALEV